MGHCYCRDHGAALGSEALYNRHFRRPEHVTGHECLGCDRQFTSEVALDHHLVSQGHVDVLQAVQNAVELEEAARENEKKALRCEKCRRGFKTLQGSEDHRRSLRHEPLSDLVCPLSGRCKKRFTSPSALLLHLESGGCKSGMNRLKLNVLIHAHDTGRQITHSENVSNVVSSATAADAMPTASDLAMSLQALSIAGLQSPAEDADAISETTTTCEGVRVEDISDMESTTSGVLIRTPSLHSCSTVGGVLLTPSNSASEWSFVNGGLATTPTTSFNDFVAATIQYDAATKAWPCIIQGCEKSFKKQDRLMQHLYSPYHAPRLFHCPTGLVMEGEEHGKVFKTTSGFAMHLESGNCACGKEALQKIVGLFEKKIQEATGNSVKLLKDSPD